MRNEIESENIRSYLCIYDGPIDFNIDEIEEVRFWDLEGIKRFLGSGIFTPNFEQEFELYLKRLNSQEELQMKN